jgi:hypothetical protein
MSVKTSARAIPWLRILTESLAIVISILFAFSIDAWWDVRRDRDREADLLAGLLADFEASRPELVTRLNGARRIARNSARFMDLIAAAPVGQVIRVPDSVVIAVLGTPTYEPSTNTLDAALSSGEIDLIRSNDIRQRLAEWRRTLVDTYEDENAAKEIVITQLVSLLAREVRLGSYYDRVLPWFFADPELDLTGEAKITVSSELEGILALRLFFADFSAQGLGALLESLDGLAALLESPARE